MLGCVECFFEGMDTDHSFTSRRRLVRVVRTQRVGFGHGWSFSTAAPPFPIGGQTAAVVVYMAQFPLDNPALFAFRKTLVG